MIYRKASNIRRTLVGNKIVDHSDVVGASPVGAAPTTSSFSTLASGFKGFSKDSHKTVRESFKCWGLVRLILETWRYHSIFLKMSFLGHKTKPKHGTVETLYNTVNFCWSTHKRHSIARPKGRGMGCLLWVQRATYCVDLSKLSSIKYLL